jgi:hypothetical protein
LCEALTEQLRPLLKGRATIDVVDVDSSVALERRYGLRIPILALGEAEITGYPLDRAAVERFLESL